MDPEQTLDKIHRDHDYLFELMERISAICDRRDEEIHCRNCSAGRRVVCQGNVGQLVQTLAEATLKHHAVEGFFMVDVVPAEHRIAHARAHIAIGDRLKAIRLEFAEEGNCVSTIDGVERAIAAIQAHIDEFDAPLEQMLAGKALPGR